MREWLDNQGRFRFGKHGGEEAGEIARTDPRYLRWVLQEIDDLDEGDRRILETLLERTGWEVRG